MLRLGAWLLGLSIAVFGSAAEGPLAWRVSRTIEAPEAFQAAAADGAFAYAIASRAVAQYDRETGRRVALSVGAAQHLNSGFFREGRLYCAHSNYPQKPERSTLFVLDPESMRLSPHHEFGDLGGSLTWAVWEDGRWWCNFARYGDDNGRTFLSEFDADWREVRRWSYPAALIRHLGRYSLSGGLWHGRLLYVTGHDDPVVFRLRRPEQGTELELVDHESLPFSGQGFAVDPVTHGLVGIQRAKQQLVFARREVSLPEPRLPRDKLLVQRGPDGSQPVKTEADWLRRRAEIVAGAQAVMGVLPGREKRCPLDVRVEEEVDGGTFVRRLLTYESEPGSRVPAYLCVPKAVLAAGAKPVSAVLCLHGTDNVIGHGTVVGITERKNRQYARELAERGYVTLAPSYPLLAKYQPDVRGLGWESGTLKAVWDNLRGLDLLDSLPYVRPRRYGVIGHSLGGHNAVYTSLFDERLVAVVSSCGLDSFLDYYDGQDQVWQPEKGWTQTRYMPRLREYRGRLVEIPFDFHELVGALAPRHVLLIAPQQDHNFRAASVDRIAAAAREVFALYGATEKLQVEHPDCTHDFPPEMRERAYRLFDDVLR